MWQSCFANCQILQTPLCSLEIPPANEVSLKDAGFIPNYSLKYTGQLQTSSSLLQSRWDNWSRPRSLLGLPQPFNYSKIFYIMIIAVKYLHALFSKHGTSDAKNQGELVLLGQEDSGGTGRRGWEVTALHTEGHVAWGNSLSQHCPLGNVPFPSSSSAEEFWGKSPAMAVLADALMRVSEDNLEQPSIFPPKKLEKETPTSSSLDQWKNWWQDLKTSAESA